MCHNDALLTLQKGLPRLPVLSICEEDDVALGCFAAAMICALEETVDHE